MNTFKKYSIAALSISLLLSAPAQAVSFAELYQLAGQTAQNLWANRPAMPSVSMPKISLPAVSLPKISMPSMPKVSMPSVSREQVETGLYAFAKYAQKAEDFMMQYPTAVSITKTAAKVVPVAMIGGYLAKKAVNQYNQIRQSSMLTPEDIRKEMIAKLDKDLIGGGMVTAVKVLQDTQAYIKDLSDRQAEKVPGSLHFERDLGRYIDIFPNFLGDLNKEWNTFVRLAIAHDNAKDNRFAEDLLLSFDRLIAQLHELNALFMHDMAEQVNNQLESEPVSANDQAEAQQDNTILVNRVIGG